MVYRTVTGLTLAAFPPPSAHPQDRSEALKLTKRISKDGLSLLIFSKVVAQEMLSVGRYGVLADKSPTTDSETLPYLAGYTCENILDWTQVEIDGRFEFDYILLREFHTIAGSSFEGRAATPRRTRTYGYGNLFISLPRLRLGYNDEGRALGVFPATLHPRRRRRGPDRGAGSATRRWSTACR
jgi:hypothetical protein